ncbi:MATE family efflux transporter [Clostridium scatologenes]|uniref:Probable multidrug resistance protein NorM n=1 Tax=Clostridium scatologenes TaxID=1548 RepID=A0A0E3M4N8_CLOSL|nr:MATE family efflux transporter [Clostridium scatologenes]AKA67644.1 MATE efflux family protein [Clostridium scatologenes]
MSNLKKNANLTEGIIWKQVLFFALPLIAASIIQQLYNTVDLIFVGNYLGKEAAAAVGASSLIVTCLVGFFTGMSVGSSVIIANIFGSGKKGKVKDAIHTAIGLSFLGGIVLFIIGYIGAPYFLKWMNVPQEILKPAVSYIRIYFLSLISLITYNMGSGIIRAMGNSKTPMYIQLVGGIVHVLMDAVFIVIFENGVNGVAWATFLSQAINAVLILYYLKHTDSEYRLQFKKIRIHKEVLLPILKIGIPSGLQSIVITLSNVFAQYHINSLGVEAIVAFTAYFKVELPIYLPIVALGQAITTFSGQNMGAGNIERVKKGAKVCILMGIGITIVSSTLLLIFGRQAFGIFNHDRVVIDYGIRIIRTSFPFYWIYVILEVLGDTIRGAGKATPPMVIILSNICVLRIVLLFVIMDFYHDVRGVAITYPITWAIAALCMLVYYLKGSWTKNFNY